MKSLPSWLALRQLAWSGTHPGPRSGAAPPLAGRPPFTAYRLLVEADALARARQAGWQLAAGQVAGPSLPPPETHPAVGAVGAQLLHELLQHSDYSLLADYYAGLAAHGLRIPHHLLAAALAEADTHRYSRQARLAYGYPALRQVLGERGQWLTQQHPTWRDLLQEVPDGTKSWSPPPPEAVQEQQFWEEARAGLVLRSVAPNEQQLLLTIARKSPAQEQRELFQGLHGALPKDGLPRLLYMLARVSPRRWSAQWQLAPAQILALATALPEETELLQAWAMAATVFQQAEWALALLERQLADEHWPRSTEAFVRVLPPEQIAALVLPRVPDGAELSDPPAPWQDALQMLRPPWPAVVVRRLVQALVDTERRGDNDLRTAARLMYMQLQRATALAQCVFVIQQLKALQAAPRFDPFNVPYASHLVTHLRLKHRLAQLFDTVDTA